MSSSLRRSTISSLMLLLQVVARSDRPVPLVVRVVSRLRLRVVPLVVRVVSRLRLRAGQSSLIHLPARTAAHHRGLTRQRSDRSAVRLPKEPRADLGQIPLVVS